MGNSSTLTSMANNSYVEEIDPKTGNVQIVSEQLTIYKFGELANSACLIALPEENAFVITGGNIKFDPDE